MTKLPKDEPELRTWCMPADTNPSGDIFGGWLMAQMDIACALAARRVAKGRVATIAVDAMEFHKPVRVGDILCCYCDVTKIGTTSVTVNVEAWAGSADHQMMERVTHGTFTFVAIDDNRKPRKVPK